jgi:hypothetical protein
MKRRPNSVTAVSLLLIAAGAVGLLYHFKELNPRRPFENAALWLEFVRSLAIVAGGFMLRGQNWARWLAIVWVAFHVIVGALHSFGQFAFHAALCVVFTCILLGRPAADYFRASAS